MENIGSSGSVGKSAMMPAIASQPGGISTSFKSFTAAPGYRGELYIDPESGTILRIITKADLKPTDPVQQEDIRIDYGPLEIAGKQYIVPLSSSILTEVAPYGDSFVKYSTRRTLFDVTYQNYRPVAQ